jgi:hypothetical protein
MLDMNQSENIILAGGGGLLFAAKVLARAPNRRRCRRLGFKYWAPTTKGRVSPWPKQDRLCQRQAVAIAFAERNVTTIGHSTHLWRIDPASNHCQWRSPNQGGIYETRCNSHRPSVRILRDAADA